MAGHPHFQSHFHPNYNPNYNPSYNLNFQNGPAGFGQGHPYPMHSTSQFSGGRGPPPSMNPSDPSAMGFIPPQMMYPGPGFFHGSSNFTINDPVITDTSTNIHNHINSGSPVLQRLYEASIEGTEINSQARHPPPRCHPKTRVTITKDIKLWMGGSGEQLLWLYGFAGVGKTAVAQTIGEFTIDNILGAAFFFSRTRKHNDPSRVFISIAYQLASRNEEYRHLVTKALVTDLGLLQKDMRTQFKKLLVEPLSAMKLEKKLLIIVDGLDECDGNAAQREIIHLISSVAKAPSSLPVVWMICSRPEYQIKHTFLSADFRVECKRRELRVDDSEARRDIETFIRAGFQEIREEYPTVDVQEDGSWPAAEDVDKIVSAASGLFIYTAVLIKFIRDPSYADPDSQIKAVIDFIENSPASTTNPLHYLDKLYEQILSSVQEGSLHLALQLLGIAAFYPKLPVLQLANLCGVAQGKFYAALNRLYSVVEVPRRENASTDSLHIFHASFIDYLKDSNRSGRFSIDENAIHAHFATQCFGVLGRTKLKYAKELAWAPKQGDTPAFSLAHQILAYSAANVWAACINLGGASNVALFDVIANFKYPFLRYIEDKIPVVQFSEFSLWLLRQVRKHNLQEIVQPVQWEEGYLKETFGSVTIDGNSENSLRAFAIGMGSNRIIVMLSSDFLILSLEG
ncbi:hypothetical protein P691DRAFT_779144 [Macrolepiota fuliginosa MF-IS2]|uniref:NACHT domain-containing protein n=1 Tax=Macrolepiota fuliginosa MF-IS2 TaxID=1400762 RepID=A0A9P6BXD3_9AGAR|nr:hypothetical protein P691DRAFT_779144 [Macrolepiota fuliginosa MF-IS2]